MRHKQTHDTESWDIALPLIPPNHQHSPFWFRRGEPRRETSLLFFVDEPSRRATVRSKAQRRSRRGEPPRDQKRRGGVLKEPSRRARETRSRRGEEERRGAVEESHREIIDDSSRITTEISKAERRSRRGEMERRTVHQRRRRGEPSIETHAESPRKARETKRRGREGERRDAEWVFLEKEREEHAKDTCPTRPGSLWPLIRRASSH